MRAMRAETFSGYEGLKLIELPKPAVTDGKVLVRITAAGVTPLDHTILSGKFHGSKAPLVLGNEGAGVVEEGGGTDFPVGSRVMFFGAYGAFEDGTYSERVAVRKEDLCLIPDNVDDVSAAGIPVAYLTAQVALTLAGFRAGKTVLAPAIGGSIGNAVTQLAGALGAKHAMSSTTNHAKAEQAKALGFNEVIDTSFEKLGDGVRRITGGYGADIVIDDARRPEVRTTAKVPQIQPARPSHEKLYSICPRFLALYVVRVRRVLVQRLREHCKSQPRDVRTHAATGRNP